jgi:hypothetical protein
MSGIRTTSDKKETWAGYVWKSALKIYLKLLILRQCIIEAEGWLNWEKGTLWRRQKRIFFKFRRGQGDEYGK